MQCIAKINYLKLNKSNLYAVPNSNREVNKHFNVKLVEKKTFPAEGGSKYMFMICCHDNNIESESKSSNISF